MQKNKVEIIGIDTAKLEVLSEAEKTALLQKASQGDKAAREKLITGNLRLVLSVIGRFSARGENPDDLFQVGCIGLMKAIDHFDTSLGVRFSTYAVPMIIGEVRRYLRDYNPVRVSRSIRDLAYRAMQTKEALQRETGREPKVEEIAQAIGLDPSYLSSLFTSCEHMTLKQFILFEKIKLAKNMLVYSSYSYIQIATYLGFCSQSHLGTEFKQATGMSLKEYRDAYAKEEFIDR